MFVSTVPPQTLYKSMEVIKFYKVSQIQTLAKLIATKPEEKSFPKSLEGGFSLCMTCTVYVCGICLKFYIAVDVSECLSCCGNMEMLWMWSHLFMVGKA